MVDKMELYKRLLDHMNNMVTKYSEIMKDPSFKYNEDVLNEIVPEYFRDAIGKNKSFSSEFQSQVKEYIEEINKTNMNFINEYFTILNKFAVNGVIDKKIGYKSFKEVSDFFNKFTEEQSRFWFRMVDENIKKQFDMFSSLVKKNQETS